MEAGGLTLCVQVGPDVTCMDVWRSCAKRNEEEEDGSQFLHLAIGHGKTCGIWKLSAGATSTKSIDFRSEISKYELVHRLTCVESKQVLCCRFSVCGELLACGGADNIVRLWGVECGVLLAELRGHLDHIYSCAFLSPRLLFSCAADGQVFGWDCVRYKRVAEFTHDSSLRSIAAISCFSHGSARLACGASDGTVTLWDIPCADWYESVAEELFDPSITVDQQNSDQEDKEEEEYFYVGKRIGTIKAHSACVTQVAFSHNARRLVTSCIDGNAKVWDALRLQEDLASQLNQRLNVAVKEYLQDGYIPFDDSCIAIADGGAGANEECLEEFYATLDEYQGRGTMGGPRADDRVPDLSSKSRRAPAKLARKRLVDSANKVDATRARLETNTDDSGILEKLRTFTSEGACRDIAFSTNALDASHEMAVSRIEHDGLIFSCSNDCMIRVWCISTGHSLFQIKTPQPCTALRAISVNSKYQHLNGTDSNVPSLSQHYIVAACGGKVLVFLLVGLVELQALVEYTKSVGTSTCAAFWAHSERPAALARALNISGYGNTARERNKLALLFHEQSMASSSAGGPQGRQLVHGSDATSFLKTFVARREEHTGDLLGSRLFSNMNRFGTSSEHVCWALVTCPFPSQELLKLLSCGEREFLKITKVPLHAFFQAITRKESLQGILSAAKCAPLKVTERNKWGGDLNLGMLKLETNKPAGTDQSVEARHFFYAYECMKDSHVSGFSPAMDTLIKPLYAKQSQNLASHSSKSKAQQGIIHKSINTAQSPQSPKSPQSCSMLSPHAKVLLSTPTTCSDLSSAASVTSPSLKSNNVENDKLYEKRGYLVDAYGPTYASCKSQKPILPSSMCNPPSRHRKPNTLSANFKQNVRTAPDIHATQSLTVSGSGRSPTSPRSPSDGSCARDGKANSFDFKNGRDKLKKGKLDKALGLSVATVLSQEDLFCISKSTISPKVPTSPRSALSPRLRQIR